MKSVTLQNRNIVNLRSNAILVKDITISFEFRSAICRHCYKEKGQENVEGAQNYIFLTLATKINRWLLSAEFKDLLL